MTETYCSYYRVKLGLAVGSPWCGLSLSPSSEDSRGYDNVGKIPSSIPTREAKIPTLMHSAIRSLSWKQGDKTPTVELWLNKIIIEQQATEAKISTKLGCIVHVGTANWADPQKEYTSIHLSYKASEFKHEKVYLSHHETSLRTEWHAGTGTGRLCMARVYSLT